MSMILDRSDPFFNELCSQTSVHAYCRGMGEEFVRMMLWCRDEREFRNLLYKCEAWGGDNPVEDLALDKLREYKLCNRIADEVEEQLDMVYSVC